MQAKSGLQYTGYTHDLRKRFQQHQRGESRWTKGRGPFKLVYYEACISEADAKARELFMKSGRGKLFLKKRLKRFLSQTG